MYVFTTIFVIEMLLKLIAFNPVQYLSDLFNIFDFFVVCASVVGLVSEFKGSLAGVLRMLRIVLKLMRAMRTGKQT